ncbi:hypothetical protein F4803DRAFT_463130 [Xylaria telfairii]|nr:hypothetical protein F4803DRAFT_463130 [Xylaria telfairii]
MYIVIQYGTLDSSFVVVGTVPRHVPDVAMKPSRQGYRRSLCQYGNTVCPMMRIIDLMTPRMRTRMPLLAVEVQHSSFSIAFHAQHRPAWQVSQVSQVSQVTTKPALHQEQAATFGSVCVLVLAWENHSLIQILADYALHMIMMFPEPSSLALATAVAKHLARLKTIVRRKGRVLGVIGLQHLESSSKKASCDWEPMPGSWRELTNLDG